MTFEDDRQMNGNLSLKPSLFVLHTLKMRSQWLAEIQKMEGKKKKKSLFCRMLEREIFHI